MISKSTGLLIIFLFLSTTLLAQIENRLEFDVKFAEAEYTTINTDEGIIGFRSLLKQSSGPTLEIFVADKDLEFERAYEVPLQLYYSMVGYYLFDSKLYLLFEKKDLSETSRFLIEADLKEQRIRQYPIDKLTEMSLKNFLVVGRKVVLQGTLDQSPILQLFDLQNGETITLPGIFFYNAKVLKLHHDRELDYFNVLIRKEVINKVYEVSLISFDTDGNLIRDVTMDNLEEKNMEYMESMLSSDDDFQEVLVGTYGQRKRSAFYGYYQNTIEDFGGQSLKFFNLHDFPNFYNYLPERKAAKLKKRLDRKKNNGKMLKNGILTLNSIKNGQTEIDNQRLSILPSNGIDEVVKVKHGSEKLMHWYDNYYLVTSKEIIRSTSQNGTDDYREVFSISKIELKTH
ncbi:hypothetical protein Belba_1947 [Belliella baltica DSM 15883]|uniref:Uncharacterized protein n=1 Tax=Belliella baltica (strain DSM 15883 / CIP 108006 / LMG 21964 / BA134) TaxID=866536 RepID=I3Z5K6_BELBD|nr:hypothetical protein [Belliella baltica]AFL84524.1 hypothetical protein Belba_1947 [Belliella baltica DSM 15883]